LTTSITATTIGARRGECAAKDDEERDRGKKGPLKYAKGMLSDAVLVAETRMLKSRLRAQAQAR